MIEFIIFSLFIIIYLTSFFKLMNLYIKKDIEPGFCSAIIVFCPIINTVVFLIFNKSKLFNNPLIYIKNDFKEFINKLNS